MKTRNRKSMRIRTHTVYIRYTRPSHLELTCNAAPKSRTLTLAKIFLHLLFNPFSANSHLIPTSKTRKNERDYGDREPAANVQTDSQVQTLHTYIQHRQTGRQAVDMVLPTMTAAQAIFFCHMPFLFRSSLRR